MHSNVPPIPRSDAENSLATNATLATMDYFGRHIWRIPKTSQTYDKWIGPVSKSMSHDITVVMNNQCWGAEKAYQRDFFNGRYIGADVSSPPYDKLAELYGARGFRADTLADVAPAIEAALACGKPAVVDVAVDPEALYSFRRDSFKHRGG